MSSNIFPGIKSDCVCLYRGQKMDKCLCEPDERVVRNYSDGIITEPMTPEQREWCVSTADWAGEGYYNRTELEALNDKDLAKAMMNALYMYAQSQY